MNGQSRDTTEVKAASIVLLLSVLFSIPPLIVFPFTGRPLAAYIVVIAFLTLNLLGLFLLRKPHPPLKLICLVVGLGTQLSLFVVYYFGWLEASAYPFVLAGIAPVLTAMIVDDRRVVFLLWAIFAVCAMFVYNRPLAPEDVVAAIEGRGDLAQHYMQVFGLLAITAAALLRRLRTFQRALSKTNEALEQRVLERTASLEQSNRDLQLAVDERTQAMAAFTLSQNQLIEAQKTESVGRLAGGIAHDFNNLLTVILSANSTARDQLARDNPVDFELETIAQAVDRASNLTGQLLAYSRQEVMLLEPVSLNQACEESAKLMQRVIGEHISVELELSACRDTVFVDRSRLDQVLMNLAVNARDAMPDGGCLSLRTESADNSIDLLVIDQGHGIPEDLLPKIFDPFVTTKPQGVGTGLGLSTVAGIVEQSGGTIDVQSIEGVGTTFTVTLPVVQAELLQKPQVTKALPHDSVQTVLVVEDDRHVLDTIERSLTTIGFNVLTADRPSKGLQFTDHSEPIHCLVSDLVMPEEDGMSFVRKFLCKRQVPVVLMTGHVPDATIRGSLVEEHVTLLRKPFRPDELVQCIMDSVAQEASGS